MKLGILRERKARIDNRVALTPKQCMSLLNRYAQLQIAIEPSEIRCFDEDEYVESGVELESDLSDCDVLVGVKEVPIEYLMEDKTYFFFSHTIKKQSYNRGLLQALVDKNIRMIDYEGIVDDTGSRVLGFGHWAGIVGAHNGLLNFGRKMGLFELAPAHSFREYSDMCHYYSLLHLPPMRIATTGSGRVSQGLQEMTARIGAMQLEKEQWKSASSGKIEAAHFPIELLYEDADGGFDKSDFFEHPEKYRCVFREYVEQFDILLNGLFWKEGIDALFDTGQISSDQWRIKSIADVTCDQHGSVPINEGSTSISDPSYGIDRQSFERVAPYQDFAETVDVMAVDNLPNELPRDASTEFGSMMASVVIPELLQSESKILDSGTICRDGKLSPRYAYLEDFYRGVE